MNYKTNLFRQRLPRRIFALILTVCMVFTMMPPVTAAEASAKDSGESETILLSGFAELAGEVREQSVPLGTSSLELNLPDALKATVYTVSEDTDVVPPTQPPVETPKPEEPAPPTVGESEPSQPQDSGEVDEPVEETPAPESEMIEEGVIPLSASPSDAENSKPELTQPSNDVTTSAAITIEGITWISEPEYDGDTEGTYIFTAVLPDGYMVEDGVALPTITVSVGQAEQSAVDKVIAMIDALPSYAELTADPPGDADPAYPAWLAKTQQTLVDIRAAKAAYDALTDEEKAQIDEARTAKLTELAELAQQLAGLMPMASTSGGVLDFKADAPKSGAGYEWNNATLTLTLTNLDYTSTNGTGIQVPDGATLVINGTNSLTVTGTMSIDSALNNVGNDGVICGSYGDLDNTATLGVLTIEGSGTLAVTCAASGELRRSCGMRAKSITMNSGSVTCTADKAVQGYGVFVKDSMTINGGSLSGIDLKSTENGQGSYGVSTETGSITVKSGGTLSGTGAIGIAAETVLTVDGGSVIARGKNGLLQNTGISVTDLTINSGTINATADDNTDMSAGVGVVGTLTVNGGTLTATSGTGTVSGGVLAIALDTGANVVAKCNIGSNTGYTDATNFAMNNDVGLSVFYEGTDQTTIAKDVKIYKPISYPALDFTTGVDKSGDGYVWDNATLTLTLTNLDYTSTDPVGIKLPSGDVKLVLVGTNSITASDPPTPVSPLYGCYGLGCAGALTISGEGTLVATAGSSTMSAGLMATGGLTMTSGTVTGIGKVGDASFGVLVMGNIIVNGGSLVGIGDITNLDSSIGIAAQSGNINITANDGILTGTGGAVGVAAGTFNPDTDVVAKYNIGGNTDYTGETNFAINDVVGMSVFYEGTTQTTIAKDVKIYKAAPAIPVVTVTLYDGSPTDYASFADAWTAATGTSNTAGATVKLLDNVNKANHFTANANPIKVPEDKIVTIDLNGFSIDRELTASTADGNVLTVYGGSLTIDDTSITKAGTITGGYNQYMGGGVFVNGTGRPSFTLLNGTITGNTAEKGGGVAITVGKAYLKGGKITANSVASATDNDECRGGGFYASATAGAMGNAIPSVEISGDITIDGNTGFDGKPSNTVFELFPAKIIGGTKPNWDTYTNFKITAPLSGKIGVGVMKSASDMTFTPSAGIVVEYNNAYNEGIIASSDLACFTSDNPDFVVRTNEAKDGIELYDANERTGIIDHPATQQKVDDAFGSGNATLSGDKITLNNNTVVDRPIIFDGVTLSLDLNGKTITGKKGADSSIKADTAEAGGDAIRLTAGAKLSVDGSKAGSAIIGGKGGDNTAQGYAGEGGIAVSIRFITGYPSAQFTMTGGEVIGGEGGYSNSARKGGNGGVAFDASTSTVTLTDVTLQGGNGGSNDGTGGTAMYGDGTYTLINVTATGGTAAASVTPNGRGVNFGGETGSLTIDGGSYTGCYGLYVDSDTVTVKIISGKFEMQGSVVSAGGSIAGTQDSSRSVSDFISTDSTIFITKGSEFVTRDSLTEPYYEETIVVGEVIISGVAASEVAQTTASVNFKPSVSGTLYWLVNPAAVPTVAELKASSNKKTVTTMAADTIALTGLTSGAEQTVYLLLENPASNKLSAVKKVEFTTLRSAPAITIADLSIDYVNETFQLPTGTEAYTDPDDIDNSYIGNAWYETQITPAIVIYVRYYEDGDMPASPSTMLTIPSRPTTPTAKTVTVKDTEIQIANTLSGEQYAIVAKGGTVNWNNANPTGKFTGLSPNTEYTVYARVPAVANTNFLSGESKTNVKTLITVNAPSVSGDGANKPGNTAPKPSAPNAGGGSITYEGGYNKDYTPSIIIGGNTYAPDMTWNTDTGKGSWEYAYTVLPGDSEIDAEVVFNPRALTDITVAAASLFADDTANASAATLKAWLETNHKVQAAYDNKVTEAVVGIYTTVDSFEQKGKTYAYTATFGGKTDSMNLAVKPITAAVTAPADITKVKDTANGYTQAQLGLPATVMVTYTGEGYTTKTAELSVIWANESLPAGFGKTATEKVFTGTIAIPTWATNMGGTSTSVKVNIINQTPLTDDQMKLTLPGWSYGEKPEPTPTGSITPSDTNGTFTYTYSTDSGNTWLTADQLPKSTGGNLSAGTYTVKMEYVGDKYAGSKTATFIVAQKELTIAVGTLAVTSKAYDGDTSATLTGTPIITGTASGDIVTVKDFAGVFATANPATGIKVTVTGFALDSADKNNYKLKTSANLELTGTIEKANGTENPAYAAALAELNKVHIVTNVTPTLGNVTLPEGWSFTGDKTAKLAGSNDNSGNQSFAVKYTSQNPNYADVTIAAQAFPVSSVSVSIGSSVAVRVIPNIGGTDTLTPVTITVTGAALPATGEYSQSTMVWSNSCPSIVTVAGNGLTDATVTAKAKGVSMVGISYPNSAPFGYVLIKVDASERPSENAIDEIKSIGDTLEQIVDKDNPSEADKGAVNAVADEITKLTDAAKDTLTKGDIESLDDLKKLVNGTLSINIDNAAESGTPPAPTGVTAVGTAIACGVDTGNVTYYVTPIAPTAKDVKMELKLDMEVDSTKGKQIQAPLFFTMTLPSGVDVSKLTIKHIKDGGVTETVSFTASGQTVSFKLDNFSGLQFVVASGGTPTPPPSGGDNDHSGSGGSGGGGSGQDAEYEFWQTVKDKIENAKTGDTVSINTKNYDKMPWYVMDALRDNPDVSLVITWNGGNIITIPVGKAQPKDTGRIYWPLSLLAELYKPGAVTDPVTPEQPNKDNPATGGTTIEITAPDGTKTVGTVTPKENGKADTPEQADEIKQDGGKDLTIPGEEGTEQESKDVQEDSKQTTSPDVDQPKRVFCLIDLISGGRTNFNCWWCWIALLAALAAIAGGVVWKVKGKKRES